MPDISSDLLTMSPFAVHRQAVEQRDFVPDEAQWRAAEALECCFQVLHGPHRHGTTQGVHLWGSVERGKAWLMDHFYQCLCVPTRCQRFYHFMQWVHQCQFELTDIADPLHALARELARDVRVLCFDELFVSDISDVILLGSPLRIMSEEGTVLVTISNQLPEQLYTDGSNCERFLPAIEAIQRHMAAVVVDSGEDHRLHPGRAEQHYWVTGAGQVGGFVKPFARLSADEVMSAQPIELECRPLAMCRYSESVFWCSYAQFCEVPLSTLDFIGLCDRYRAVLMDDLPCLSVSRREGRTVCGTENGAQLVETGDRELPQLSVHDDGMWRFIALTDECYDRKVPLYLEAKVPLEIFYTEGCLAFAFRRTLNRPCEIQLACFGNDGVGQRRAAEVGTADGCPCSSAGQTEAQ